MRDFCLDNLDVSLDQGILDTHKGSFGHLLIASGDTGYGVDRSSAQWDPTDASTKLPLKFKTLGRV